VRSVPLPTSRWPFRHVAFALGVTAFGAGLPTPLYAIYETRYGFSSGTLAVVFAAYTIGVLVTTFLVAPLSDAIGRKPVLFVGMGLTALSGIAFVLATGVPGLALARIVSGLAVGATTSTATASMAGLEPRGDQHHVARVSVAANFGGVASGIALAGVLAEFGPRPTETVFWVLIAVSAVALVLVATTPETVPPQIRSRRVRVQRMSVPSAIRLPFWVAAGALAACYSIYGLFAALAPTFLRTEIGVTNLAESAGVIAVLFAFCAIVQLALGEVRDRRALLDGFPIVLVGLAGLVLALPLASLPLLLVSAAVLGVGIGFAYMGSVTLIDRVSPSAQRGEILAAFFVVGYLALAVPTIGIGLAADAVGLGASAITFGAALGLFVAVLWVVLRRTPTPAGGEGRARDAA
jgi:MFS family permease